MLSTQRNYARLRLDVTAEVLVAPTAIHIGLVKQALRKDVAVAVQDIHTVKVCDAAVIPWNIFAIRCRQVNKQLANYMRHGTLQGVGAYTGSHTAELIKGE